MYGENGGLLRAELSSLLRQHRVQLRIGGDGSHTVPVSTTAEERRQLGEQIRRYRQSALVWCRHATRAIEPYASSNLTRTVANPFRLPTIQHGGLAALGQALHHTVEASTAPLPGMHELTTPQNLPMVEHWRQVARAAALGEHDFDAGLGDGRLDNQQAHTLIGDVAATVRALVVLDQRYANIPGWEKLHHADRLGWSALACAVDASMEPPDYAIDMRGWRPKAKVIDGPAKPGLLGVLQAEHNLVIRMQSFPNAMNLRLVIDSQRLLSSDLAKLAKGTDPELQQQWHTRERTYADLQRELRNVGGRLGKGGLAVAEGANAIGRLKEIRPDSDLDPRMLHAFTTLFHRLDDRIADVIETGIDRHAYFARVKLPRLDEHSGAMVAPIRTRFIPLAEADHRAIIDLVRDRLRPPPGQPPLRGAKRSRAELHAAIVHRPAKGASPDAPSL
ncbi:hypothetical protein KUV85_02220 [Nocardioides panacisoli]|uniref:hypothetical protein n=1 Tax=Nocardioides panacisoli TaxID=627624 RepID=UPI001C625B34|nr:hypothetical protein [Nocardioides panacisoli]QYJ04515.1 hypothetical protein KUV85_02220 [Nocardioides panacisoli]